MSLPRAVGLVGVIAAASALVLAGCGSPTAGGSGGDVQVAVPALAPVAVVAAAKPCKDGLAPTASLAPGDVTTDPDTIKSSPTLKQIRKKNRLTVGTSGDVLLWGSRNPTTGKLEGYDIDVLTEVAKALNVPISYKVITYGQRLTELDAKTVDLVAHTMTINCDRWQGSGNAPNAINFSSEYYRAGQKVLVRSDTTKRRIEGFKGQKVCVPSESTNETQVAEMGLDLVKLPVVGDCLVQFQEGEVEAVTGDDTVLAGFAAQDPYSKVIGAAFSAEPYGLGVNADDPEFTKFVNAVLEQLRSDGTLQRLYDKWMADAVEGAAPPIPQAVYGRESTLAALGR